jgi:hypothetical protein
MVAQLPARPDRLDGMLPRLLAAALCGLALVPTAASASSHRAPVSAIVRDCVSDGTLDRHYRSVDLLRAHRHLPADVVEYSQCDDLLIAQRARTVGRRATGSPTRECAAHGTLRHRYTARALRSALRRGTGACRPILRAQLVAWTKPVWPAS